MDVTKKDTEEQLDLMISFPDMSEEIANVLYTNTSLQELPLSINNFGDKGVEEITKLLYKNTKHDPKK